jgi:preprotein translocase subunit SecG
VSVARIEIDLDMLIGVLLTINIIVCIALIGVVLMQRSEGGALGMGGGGGGFMTARGAGDLLTRTTWILFSIFLIISLALTILTGRMGASNSVVDRLKLDGLDSKTLNAAPLPAGPTAPAPTTTLPARPLRRPPARPRSRLRPRRSAPRPRPSRRPSRPPGRQGSGQGARRRAGSGDQRPGSGRPEAGPVRVGGNFTVDERRSFPRRRRITANLIAHDPVHFHHRRRGFLIGKRPRLRSARSAPAGSRLQGSPS